MFDVIFDILGAVNHIGLFIMACVCLLIGGGIIAYDVHWRMTSKRIKGRLKGVRISQRTSDGHTSDYYYPVYEYTAPNGERMESVSDFGTGSILGYKIGQEVSLMMSVHDFKNVRRPTKVIFVIGMVFFLPGVFILHVALTQFEFNIVTVLMVFAGLGYVAYKILAFVRKIPVADRREFWAEMKNKGISIKSSGKAETYHLLEAHEIEARMKKQTKNSRIAGIVMLIISLGLGWGAHYFWQDMNVRLADGALARGEVVDMQYNSSDDGGTYSAVVTFKDERGQRHKFKDSVGSSHPTLKRGDEVDVIYMRDDPKDAIIDRGIWNWAISGGLGLAAVLMLWFGFSGLMQSSPMSSGRGKFPDRV